MSVDLTAAMPRQRSVAELLSEARSRLRRMTAREVDAARALGVVIVDIRPIAQRRVEREIPGAFIIERNVLEWRLDPASDVRIDGLANYDRRIVVFCSEGYTSSLAAASLLDLGLHRATDLVGGIRAWKACGLPTVPGGTSSGGRSPAAVIDGR
jgi:rhodanese-related sulfurtransferase